MNLLGACISSLSVDRIEHPSRSNLGRERLFWLTVPEAMESTRAGKTWQQAEARTWLITSHPHTGGRDKGKDVGSVLKNRSTDDKIMSKFLQLHKNIEIGPKISESWGSAKASWMPGNKSLSM